MDPMGLTNQDLMEFSQGFQSYPIIHLTWPMAKRLKLFGIYIFSRDNKVQTFISGFHSLSEPFSEVKGGLQSEWCFGKGNFSPNVPIGLVYLVYLPTFS